MTAWASRAILFLIGTLAIPSAPTDRQEPSPVAVWIDADPAVGVPDRDVDDGVALVQAFRSPELEVRGVSIVFGNTTLERAWPIGRYIVRRFGGGLPAYRGAASAADLGVETPASRALARALEGGPLVILALGPLTNVATVLRNHPELAPKVAQVVAVAGRRPGQRFTTGTVNRNGHRDFNFEQDPEAFRILLSGTVPLTLAPFELSSKVWITEDDLGHLARGSEAGRWLVPAARGWLGLWKRTFGVDGFNPFDALAVARVTSPDLLVCETLPARIDVLPDDLTEARMQGTAVARKPYLLVSSRFAAERSVEYCHDVKDGFKSDLLARLTARDR